MELCNDITRITLIDAYNEGIYVFFLVFYVAFYFILWLNTFLSSWSRRRSNNITGFGCDIWLFVLLFVTLGCCSCSCKSNTFLNKWTELYIFIEILFFSLCTEVILPYGRVLPCFSSVTGRQRQVLDYHSATSRGDIR